LSSLGLAKPGFPVFGYLPMYDSTGPYGDAINLNDNAKFPWDRLTHVTEAFAQPSSTGTISFPTPQRANLVLKAHQNNTRCLLSIGGAGSNNSDWASAVSAANRTNFVNNLVSVASTNGYDGIDIDWEFPQASDQANFTAFMVALGTALHGQSINCGGCAFNGQPKQLTFFGSPGDQICGVDWDNTSLQSAVDYCIYGGYDFNAPPGYNSPTSTSWLQSDCRGISYDFCLTQTVKVLTGVTGTDFSWPKSKLILALPLYDKQVYSTFSSGTPVLVALKQGTFIAMDTPQDEARYNVGGATHYVNNDTAFCRKMSWALSSGIAGIGLWEISHAYPANDAAVTSLWNTIGGTASCINVTTPTPGPTPNAVPGDLIDIGNSGNLNNLWGGQWSTSVGTGSSITMSYTAPGYASSSYNSSGPYSIQATVTKGANWANVATCLQPACAAYNADSNGYTRVDFWLKATPGNYRIDFARTATSTDSDHYGIDFQVADNNWDYYSFYLSDSSQQGWGVAKPKNFTDMTQIVFLVTGAAGSYTLNIDDLEMIKQMVTPTPVPPSYLLDNVEDGNSTNNWGGAWSTWAPAGSSISVANMRASGFPFSTYGPKYSAEANGNNSTSSNLGTFTTLLAPGAAAVNLSAYNYINFAVKASSSAGTFGLQFTDQSTFWVTIPFSVPNDGNWYNISLPLSSLLPTNITKPKAISWLYNAAGAYDISVDDIWFENRPPTPTPSYTQTGTPTSTKTASPTNSPSPTPSSSPTQTPSVTPSASPSATPSSSPTLTASPTASPTPSVTLSSTPVPAGSTPTMTSTISPTWTDTRTLTPSPTLSWTASETVTLTATPTATPSDSPTFTETPSRTATLTVTSSFTPVPAGSSPTATPTQSPVLPTATATPTQSPMAPSATATRTQSPVGPSATATPSQSPAPAGSTATATPTVSPVVAGGTATFTKTLTPASAATAIGGTLQILAGRPFPNPEPQSIRVLLDGPADVVRLKIYTVNMQVLGKVEAFPGSNYNGGWCAVPLDADLRGKLPNGTLYFVVEAQRGATRSLKPLVGTFVHLR
jgi:spore germination protein YaaH